MSTTKLAEALQFIELMSREFSGQVVPATMGDIARAALASYEAAQADAKPAARTAQEIVDQTEELAGALMLWAHRREAKDGYGSYRDAEDPRGKSCWQMACKAQEILTATDPENAVSELDDEPAAPAAPAPSDVRSGWSTPTTYAHRFAHAVSLLCGKWPDASMVEAWLDKSGDGLQDFAASHGPEWAQGIVLLDAAAVMADTPTEGVEHGERAPAAPAHVPEANFGNIRPLTDAELDAVWARDCDTGGRRANFRRGYRYAVQQLTAAPAAPAPAPLTDEPAAWINWSALTGEPRLGWQCESEIASEPLYRKAKP